MSVFSRKMKRVEVIILIILPLCFLHAENVKQTARAALIYCKRPEYIPPVNDYDDICSNLGWTLEKWENAELDKLIKNLNCYDIVLCGRMYNFANPQPFEKYTKQWLAFMKRGGVIIVAPVMDSPIKWINALGPGFRLRPKGYTGTTRKTIANPKAKLNFGCVIARWAEFGQVSPHWVIANRNDQGMPIVMYQEVGNGLFLASAAYGAKGQRNSFPVEKDLRIIWNFIIDKRKNAVPVEVTSLAWGKKMLGENILQIAVKDKTAKTAKILPTVTLSRNRENIFSSPARNREIASVARQEISLPYSITSAVPDLITFTLRGPAGEIYFRSTGKINIEDLKAPLEKARVKLAKVEKIISFLKTVPVTASCRWLKGYIDNKAKEYSSLYREIDVLEKELERIAKQGSLPAWNGKSKIIRRETENVDKLNSELEVLAKRAKTWENLRLGTADRNKLFTLSEASSFDKVFRDRTWKKPVTRQLRFKMAANEYESAQLVVIPLAQKLEGVKISCSDLTGANGKNRITSENIDLHRVAYVFSSEGKWHPDPLLRNRPFNINSSQVVQPIWITVHTPTDTAPGEYKGVLTVQSREPADKISLPVSVKVWNFEIPQKLNLPTDAGLRVTTLAEFFYGKAGYKDPEKYISASEYRKFLKFLLRYRLTPKPFIYTGQHLAWVPYLKWQLRKDKLTIDFTEYDKNVKLILDNGGNVVYAGNLPAFFASAAKTKVRLIKEFIPLMYEHLKQKGWNDIAYFYGFDEPKGSKVEAVKKEMALSGKLAPGVKRMVVYGSKDFVRKIFAESKLGEYIDIWVPHRHQLFDRKFIRQLQSRGETVWAYDSGGPTYDIFSKNIEKRIFLWILRKYKLKGFVIWATTRCWGNLADIKEDGTPEKSWKTGSGDGYYAYPAGKKLENGLNPSIRLEVMRDGFEDWEYFRLLEAKLKELKNRNKGNRYQALIKKTEKLLTIDDQLVKDSRTYTNNPQKLLAKRIELAGQIEKFNRVLKSNKLKITK